MFRNTETKGNIATKAALRNCSYKKMFWKYVVNLQENIHAEVQFQ